MQGPYLQHIGRMRVERVADPCRRFFVRVAPLELRIKVACTSVVSPLLPPAPVRGFSNFNFRVGRHGIEDRRYFDATSGT
jgi:hypothetical protein